MNKEKEVIQDNAHIFFSAIAFLNAVRFPQFKSD